MYWSNNKNYKVVFSSQFEALVDEVNRELEDAEQTKIYSHAEVVEYIVNLHPEINDVDDNEFTRIEEQLFTYIHKGSSGEALAILTEECTVPASETDVVNDGYCFSAASGYRIYERNGEWELDGNPDDDFHVFDTDDLAEFVKALAELGLKLKNESLEGFEAFINKHDFYIQSDRFENPKDSTDLASIDTDGALAMIEADLDLEGDEVLSLYPELELIK